VDTALASEGIHGMKYYTIFENALLTLLSSVNTHVGQHCPDDKARELHTIIPPLQGSEHWSAIIMEKRVLSPDELWNNPVNPNREPLLNFL